MENEVSFLVLSEGGDGFGLALRLQAEGHKTAMWIRDSESNKRGEGLIEKSERPSLNPVIIADCTGLGDLLDIYRDSDTLTFAGSKVMDDLESDRKFSSQVFKDAGIKEPKSKEFSNWDEARDFVQSGEDDAKLVFKPEGGLSGNLPSYVSSDKQDMLGMLNYFSKTYEESEPQFILQEFIEGVCISSEAWYSKDHFIYPTNHTFERKAVYNEDLGPSGGCSGNVVWLCDMPEACPLCQNLAKLEPFLQEHAYNGPIDINSVVSEEGKIYALEFTPRFGYDAFPTFLYGLFEGDFGEFVYACAAGSGPERMSLKPGFAAGVRISTPPWPSEDFHAKQGLPISGVSKNDFSRFYPYEVSAQDSGLVTSGGVGIVGVCIGYGSTIEDCFAEAYKVAKKIRVPEKQYRTDLAEVFKRDLRHVSKYLEVKV
jgi:phosphoribosylamine-glycine ligase